MDDQTMLEQRQKQHQMQIDQMISSVEAVREQDIDTVGEQVYLRQLEFERTREMRRSKLEGEGEQLSRAFVDRTALVDQPVIQRGDTKSKRSMQKDVTKKYKKARSLLAADETEQRRQYATGEVPQEMKEKAAGSELIHTSSFSTSFHYENMLEARKYMHRYPESYQENKAAVDAMYRDLHVTMEVLGAYTAQMRSYADLQSDEEIANSPEMFREVSKRMDSLYQKVQMFEHRETLLLTGIKNLLEGNVPGDDVRDFLRAYTDRALYSPEEIANTKEQASKARVFTSGKREITKALLRQKLTDKRAANGEEPLSEAQLTEQVNDLLASETGRSMVLIREDDNAWNEKVADAILLGAGNKTKATEEQYSKLSKELAMFSFDRLRELNIESFIKMSYTELMKHKDEIEELGYMSQRASDLAKAKVYEEGVGLSKDKSIKTAYFETNGVKEATFTALQTLVQNLAGKARMLWYIEAYKEGINLREVMTAGELDTQSPQAGNEELLQWAERRLEAVNRYIKLAVDKYRASTGGGNA